MKRTLQKGFTLVELLIVMAIIAILAVGVMIGLNPVEQIAKSSDSSSSRLAGEVGRSLDAYYAAMTKYPFNGSPTTAKYVKWDYYDAAPDPDISSGVRGTTDILSNELKAATMTKISTDNNIFVGNNASAEPTACYIPKSKTARAAIQNNSSYQGFTYRMLTRTAAGVASAFTFTAVPTYANCDIDAEWEDANTAGDTVCVLCI